MCTALDILRLMLLHPQCAAHYAEDANNGIGTFLICPPSCSHLESLVRTTVCNKFLGLSTSCLEVLHLHHEGRAAHLSVCG